MEYAKIQLTGEKAENLMFQIGTSSSEHVGRDMDFLQKGTK